MLAATERDYRPTIFTRYSDTNTLFVWTLDHSAHVHFAEISVFDWSVGSQRERRRRRRGLLWAGGRAGDRGGCVGGGGGGLPRIQGQACHVSHDTWLPACLVNLQDLALLCGIFSSCCLKHFPLFELQRPLPAAASSSFGVYENAMLLLLITTNGR